MQNRNQSVVVQVFLALLCALGAGFSGDMQARHTGQASHHARHARGGQQRGVRSAGRDNNGDHAHEIDLAQDSVVSNPSASGTAAHASVAILPERPSISLEWVQVGSALAVSTGFPAAVDVLSLPSRGPPALS